MTKLDSHERQLPKLGARLSAVGQQIIEGKPMADIGTDHGRLPIALVNDGWVPSAVAADRKRDPLAVAQRHRQQAGLDGRIDLRLGDGLAVLNRGEVGSIAIAGMGGPLMAGIMERGLRPLFTDIGGPRVVAQPQGGAGTLRKTMGELGYGVVDESVVFERGLYYVVIVFERDTGRVIDESSDLLDLRIGPIVRAVAGGEKSGDAARGYIEHELQRARRACCEAGKGDRAGTSRVVQIQSWVELLEAELTRVRQLATTESE